jgi:hypothetical protein
MQSASITEPPLSDSLDPAERIVNTKSLSGSGKNPLHPDSFNLPGDAEEPAAILETSKVLVADVADLEATPSDPKPRTPEVVPLLSLHSDEERTARLEQQIITLREQLRTARRESTIKRPPSKTSWVTLLMLGAACFAAGFMIALSILR